MKKILTIALSMLFMFSLVSCFDTISEVDSLEFKEQPKVIYLKNEAMQTISVTAVVGGVSTTVNSSSSLLNISGFDTTTIGTKTLTVTYKDCSITATYRVVENLEDGYFAAGSGTETDPYQIKTIQNLDNIRLVANKNKYFKLMNDLNMIGYNWEPIGIYYADTNIGQGNTGAQLLNPFKGTFDGNGYSIINLTINDDGIQLTGELANQNSYALFGCTEDAVFKNLTLKDVVVNAPTHTENASAAFVGYSNGKIIFENCVVKNAQIIGVNTAAIFVAKTYNNPSGSKYSDCTILDSKATAVYVLGNSGQKAGGFTAIVKGEKVTFENCNVNVLNLYTKSTAGNFMNIFIGFQQASNISAEPTGTFENCKGNDVTIN